MHQIKPAFLYYHIGEVSKIVTLGFEQTTFWFVRTGMVVPLTGGSAFFCKELNMPAWLIPVLKSILPHVGTIVSAAAPVFTRKSADAAANQAVLLQQQVSELQAAATENDVHIKELAVQLQNTVAVWEQASALAQSRHRTIMLFCIAAALLSAISLCGVLYMLIAR